MGRIADMPQICQDEAGIGTPCAVFEHVGGGLPLAVFKSDTGLSWNVVASRRLAVPLAERFATRVAAAR